ncbi:hypothetical protein HMPREF3193_02276 [Bifidobacterium breve]|nr:hypothetical protein HMPREF3193_02276 [Bifidobacterium breve]
MLGDMPQHFDWRIRRTGYGWGQCDWRRWWGIMIDSSARVWAMRLNIRSAR